MIEAKYIDRSGDPWHVQQEFKKLDINILCCRYWWFEAWKGDSMSFPFWRIYWNKSHGSHVYFNKRIDLLPEKLYIIPPHTAYTNHFLKGSSDTGSRYFFRGGKIHSQEEEARHQSSGDMLHFFVHFTLDYPYDHTGPGVYEVDLDAHFRSAIQGITHHLFNEGNPFSIHQTLAIDALIRGVLLQLPEKIWDQTTVDPRITKAVQSINDLSNEPLVIERLAEGSSMSVTGFAKLFKTQTGQTPGQYIIRTRINKARNLLLYSSDDISAIAQACGFCDRYHFSKAFKRSTGYSPAAYRRVVVS